MEKSTVKIALRILKRENGNKSQKKAKKGRFTLPYIEHVV